MDYVEVLYYPSESGSRLTMVADVNGKHVAFEHHIGDLTNFNEENLDKILDFLLNISKREILKVIKG